MYNIKYQNPYVERLIKQRCNKPIETDILEDKPQIASVEQVKRSRPFGTKY